MAPSLQIPATEFDARLARLLEYLRGRALSGAVLFDPDYVLYFSGFAFIPTERPIALLVSPGGERVLFVPRLEAEHARAQSGVDRVVTYVEYPDDPHPMTGLAATIESLGITGEIGADQDGYPWLFGYQGPALSAVSGARVTRLAAAIEQWMMIKSENEIALLRESARWGNLAHRLLQRYTRVGRSETEVTMRAGQEATLTMLDTLGGLYRGQSRFARGASAGYRGQIGRNAAIPHALANHITFQPGDILVTGAGAPVWGYHSELERTMVIGPPTDAQRRLFDHMVALQELAFERMVPGRPCAEVDRAVRDYYVSHDLTDHWRHHTGHAIGLRYHEGPFLDIGDPTPLAPGMVFTVEPGLYAPEMGGFRHSDTVVVREEGIEFLTYYPRDLDSLTLPL